MRKQHHIVLTPEQRAAAQAVLSRGNAAADDRHARILLEADEAVARRRVRTDAVRSPRGAELAPALWPGCESALPPTALPWPGHGRPHPGAAPKLSADPGSAPHCPGLHRAAGGSSALERAAAG